MDVVNLFWNWNVNQLGLEKFQKSLDIAVLHKQQAAMEHIG